MTISIPSHLSDPALVAEVTRLARLEHEATAALVAHLAEFDARRLYLGAGFPSLFAYCTEVLRLSEHGTYNRIEAARVVRKCPVILEMLGDGSLNLATVRLLAPHLTIENHRSLLEAAAGRSKREVAELVVRHFPRRALRTLVRKLPARNAAGHPAQVRDGDGRSGRRDETIVLLHQVRYRGHDQTGVVPRRSSCRWCGWMRVVVHQKSQTLLARRRLCLGNSQLGRQRRHLRKTGISFASRRAPRRTENYGRSRSC
jgi:hypothetical protein